MRFFYKFFCVIAIMFGSSFSYSMASYAHAVVSGVEGTTPVHIAAVNGGPAEDISFYLNAGLYLNARDEELHTPLYLALYHGNLGFAHVLVGYGAYCGELGTFVDPLLHEMIEDDIDPQVLSSVIDWQEVHKCGTHIDTRDRHGRTALMATVLMGDHKAETMRVLLDHGAGIYTLSNGYENALKMALAGGYVSLVDEFLSVWDQAQEPYLATPLHYAVIAGNNDEVYRLLTHNENVNALDRHCRTPLFWALSFGETNIASLLLRPWTRLPLADSSGNTPLHTLCYRLDKKTPELYKTMEKLLEWHNERGWGVFDINAKNDEGDSVLLFLARGGNQNKEVIQLLRDHGAGIYATDAKGMNILEVAFHNRFLELADLVTPHWKVAQDPCGATPLHYAARAGHVSDAEELVQQGADLNAEDKKGETPVMWALKACRIEFADFLIRSGAESEQFRPRAQSNP